MWTEMLFNRSFEKVFPITYMTHAWFKGNDLRLGPDWSVEEWYHNAYEHSRWYAFPGKDAAPAITPDATYLIEQTPLYSLRLIQKEGGVHGTHCLVIDNFDDRPAGVAQDGKRIRAGRNYRFSGYFRAIDAPATAELCMYETQNAPDCAPFVRMSLGTIGTEGGFKEAVFSSGDYEGEATFAILVPGGSKVEIDAFSLMPTDSADGWRPDVIDAIKELKPSVLRFPGGNFGSFHRWTDAIGPQNTRTIEPSIMWGDLNYNDVGTDEFLSLCEMTGAAPMLLVNMYHPRKRYHFQSFPEITAYGGLQRHGQELTHVLDKEEGIETARKWVEYCNGDASTPMGQLRAENGHPAPYGVRYWEMDNEPWRWFTPGEYAEYVRRYAGAMRSVDPEIKIGICSYHTFSDVIEEILELCGDCVDFIADRMCEPYNIKRKTTIVQKYNETHKNRITYTDTEALQNRPLTLAPFTAAYYEENGIDFCTSRRTWIYALTMAGNLLHYERYGSLVGFMCFNNLCNTAGQSCIEVSKEETVFSAAGLLMKQMAHTQAAWPVEIEDYEPDSLRSIEVQAAYTIDRKGLVLNLVNKCDVDTEITLDLSEVLKVIGPADPSRMHASRVTLYAENGAVQETIKNHGNIREEREETETDATGPVRFSCPAFSFSEIVM